MRPRDLAFLVEEAGEEHADGKETDREVSESHEPAEREADEKADEVANDLHDGGAKDDKKKDRPGAKGDSRKPGAATEKPISAKLDGVARKVFLSEDKKSDDKKPKAADGGIVIHSDAEAEAYLNWAAKCQGVPAASMQAATLGVDIFVRPALQDNVRVLREEMIHVKQQKAGIGSNKIVDGEIAARIEMVANRLKWGITNDEVREMIREIRQMRKTGKY